MMEGRVWRMLWIHSWTLAAAEHITYSKFSIRFLVLIGALVLKHLADLSWELLRMLFFFLFFFISGGVTKARATVPPLARGLWERLSGRCENTKSCCFSSSLHAPPTPPPSLSCVWPPGRWLLRSLGVDEWGVLRSHVRGVLLGHWSLGAQVAGRRPVSTFIHRRSNSAWDNLIISSHISPQHKQCVFGAQI